MSSEDLESSKHSRSTFKEGSVEENFSDENLYDESSESEEIQLTEKQILEHQKNRDKLLQEITRWLIELGKLGQEIREVEARDKINFEDIDENHPLKQQYAKKTHDLIEKIHALKEKIQTIEDALPKTKALDKLSLNSTLLADIISNQLKISVESFPELMKDLARVSSVCATDHDKGLLEFCLGAFLAVYVKAADDRMGEVDEFLSDLGGFDREKEVFEGFRAGLANDDSIDDSIDTDSADVLEYFTGKRATPNAKLIYQLFWHDKAQENFNSTVEWFQELPETLDDIKAIEKKEVRKFYQELIEDYKNTTDEQLKAAIHVLIKSCKILYNTDCSAQDIRSLKIATHHAQQIFFPKGGGELMPLSDYQAALSDIEARVKKHQGRAAWKGLLEAMLILLGILVIGAALAAAIVLFSFAVPLAATATFMLLGVSFTAATAKLIAGVALVGGALLATASFFGAGAMSNTAKASSDKSKEFSSLYKSMEEGGAESTAGLTSKAQEQFNAIVGILNLWSNFTVVPSNLKENIQALETRLLNYQGTMEKIARIALAQNSHVLPVQISGEKIELYLEDYAHERDGASADDRASVAHIKSIFERAQDAISDYNDHLHSVEVNASPLTPEAYFRSKEYQTETVGDRIMHAIYLAHCITLQELLDHDQQLVDKIRCYCETNSPHAKEDDQITYEKVLDIMNNADLTNPAKIESLKKSLPRYGEPTLFKMVFPENLRTMERIMETFNLIERECPATDLKNI